MSSLWPTKWPPKVIPVIEPMEIRRCTVYEHTPADYYGRGEYPRYIRPVGAYQPRTRIVTDASRQTQDA